MTSSNGTTNAFGIPPGQWAQLALLFTRKEYGSDDYVFFEGESPVQVWFVESGRVKLLKHSDTGKDVIVTVVPAGGVVGEFSLGSEVPYPVTAQTVGHAVMLAVPRQAFLELLRLHPDLGLLVINNLGRHLDEAYETIRSLAVERVERRIARLLLKLAASVGKASGRNIIIDMPLTRQDIAEMTGTTVESAIRVMSKLRKQGVVESREGKLYLTEPHALVVIADELSQ